MTRYPAMRVDPRLTSLVRVGDETWAAIAPLIPAPRPRRSKHTGRKPLDDRTVLTGILTILINRIGIERLPTELGCGSGMTCWRRLRYWHECGAWPAIADRLREVLPADADIDLGRVDRLFASHGARRSAPERAA